MGTHLSGDRLSGWMGKKGFHVKDSSPSGAGGGFCFSEEPIHLNHKDERHFRPPKENLQNVDRRLVFFFILLLF